MGTRTYGDAELAEAVAASHSWRGVLRHLGLVASSSSAIRSAKKHADRLGLDTRHFTGQRRWTEDQLAEAIANSRTWSQVQTTLGLSGGSSTTLLKGHAVRLGIDVRHLNSAPPGPPPDLPVMCPELSLLPKAGASMAASWLALCGYEVSWPLEPCRYDVVAGRHGRFLRIQVKTTRVSSAGSWIVSLATDGGRLTYDPEDIDHFFVIDGALDYYLIPVTSVGGLYTVTLSAYSTYKLSRHLTGLTSPVPSSATP